MCASKPKDSAIRAVLRTILDVCTPEAMRHVAYSERNCDTALSSSCILFTFVVLTGFSTCKDSEKCKGKRKLHFRLDYAEPHPIFAYCAKIVKDKGRIKQIYLFFMSNHTLFSIQSQIRGGRLFAYIKVEKPGSPFYSPQTVFAIFFIVAILFHISCSEIELFPDKFLKLP